MIRAIFRGARAPLLAPAALLTLVLALASLARRRSALVAAAVDAAVALVGNAAGTPVPAGGTNADGSSSWRGERLPKNVLVPVSTGAGGGDAAAGAGAGG